MLNLFYNRQQALQDYIDRIPLKKTDKECMMNEEFIKNNPKIYLLYPEVFSKAFTISSKINKHLRSLNISGYLYYRSLLEIDKAVDRRDTDKGQMIGHLPIISSLCQEESIKLLTTVFPISHQFWKFWSKRRGEYFAALSIDKGQSKVESLKDFETYADYKSAFGKIAIDSVFILTKQKKQITYRNLLKSHKYFSVGLQLLDDITDFKEDIIHPQFNYGFFSLEIKLREKGIDIASLDKDLLVKYFYIYGIAEDMIIQAINYFKKSLKLVSGLNLDLWEDAHVKKIKSAEILSSHIRTYKISIHSKLVLSNKSYLESSSNQGSLERLELCKLFIIKHQNPNGSWFDFQNKAGASDIWSTGFVLSNILSSGATFDTTMIEKSIRFLQKTKQNGMWGYNSTWIPDTDSTTFVLMALKLANKYPKNEIDKWLKFQNKNGGFSTYSNKEELLISLNDEFNDVAGWTQSHPCVSTAAFYFISKFGVDKEVHTKLLKYVLASKESNNLWNSYWWTSPVYSTSYALKALLASGYTINDDIIRNSFKALASLQNRDGSYLNSVGEKSAFFTALALSAFTSTRAVFTKYEKKAYSARQWLLSVQFNDGSFPSSHSLRLPEASVTNADKIIKWDKSSTKSTNVVVHDFMRMFSTSMAFQSLYAFEELTNPNFTQ